ncbi:YdcF family protein [Rhodococcus sp. NPDC047139]|uniref:YdcF family protein n=1 Tax=Rhodococcus sp. NPDC047139 TaxID=3155141 RepID=UPI003405A86F
MMRRRRAARKSSSEAFDGAAFPAGARRRRRRWVTIAVLALCALLAAGVPVYVTPQIEIEYMSPYRRADAIFVLGGAVYERYPYALALAMEGFAPQVVVSNPDGAEDIWLTDLCSHRRYDFPVSCFEPNPPTTRGEAQELRRLAALNGWTSVIVVTFVPHISRARFILERCFDGELVMAASPADISLSYWVWAYAYQTAGYARALSHTGC